MADNFTYAIEDLLQRTDFDMNELRKLFNKAGSATHKKLARQLRRYIPLKAARAKKRLTLAKRKRRGGAFSAVATFNQALKVHAGKLPHRQLKKGISVATTGRQRKLIPRSFMLRKPGSKELQGSVGDRRIYQNPNNRSRNRAQSVNHKIKVSEVYAKEAPAIARQELAVAMRGVGAYYRKRAGTRKSKGKPITMSVSL